MRTRLLLRLLAMAAVVVGVTASVAHADGTETLGTPSIPIVQGTGVLVAGVGTELAQPSSFSFAVPGTVKQSLVYWTGHYSTMLGGTGDDKIYVRNAAFVPVLATFGRTTAGAGLGCPGADRKFGNFFALPVDGIVTKLTARFKGKADGTGLSQEYRAMIYDNSGPGGTPGKLLATSAVVSIPETAAEAPVDFALAQPRFLAAGNYFLALQSGGTTGKGCISQTKPSPDPADVNHFNVDAFANGPSNPYGAATVESAGYTISATYETPGIPVTGQLIGGPKLFFTSGVDFRFATYRADITALGLVAGGANTLTVSGLGFIGRDGFGNDGAGVLVNYQDAPGSSTIGIKDGQDLAFDPAVFLPEPTEVTAAERQTALQTFTFAASPMPRVAQLALIAASVEGDASGFGPFRPNRVEVKFGLTGGTGDVTLMNPFSSTSGAEFDARNLTVTVPATATTMTLQALSLPDPADLAARPASFNWAVASVALPDAPKCVPKKDDHHGGYKPKTYGGNHNDHDDECEEECKDDKHKSSTRYGGGHDDECDEDPCKDDHKYKSSSYGGGHDDECDEDPCKDDHKYKSSSYGGGHDDDCEDDVQERSQVLEPLRRRP